MSLSSLEKITKTQAPTTETITHSDTEGNKSSNSEADEPSPKRINQKKTPAATTSTSANMPPSRRSSRQRQSTLAKAFGDPIPINTINESDTRTKPVNFNIDSPDQIYPSAKPMDILYIDHKASSKVTDKNANKEATQEEHEKLEDDNITQEVDEPMK